MLQKISAFIARASLLVMVGYNLYSLYLPTHKGGYYLADASDVRVYPVSVATEGSTIPITEGPHGPETGRVEVRVSWLRVDQRVSDLASMNLFLASLALSAQVVYLYSRRNK